MIVRSMLSSSINSLLRTVTGMHIDVYPETEVVSITRNKGDNLVIDTAKDTFASNDLNLLVNPNSQIVDKRFCVHYTNDEWQKDKSTLACVVGVCEHIIRNNIREWDCMVGLAVNHMDSCGTHDHNDRLYNLELVTETQNNVHQAVLTKINKIFKEQNRYFALSAEDDYTINFIKYHSPLEIMYWLKSQEIEKDWRGYEYVGLAAFKLRRWKKIWAEQKKQQQMKKEVYANG